ncbi:hypothetical protein L2E82_21656 [Cichorium intybus]|uniref:Uncharacterized protein n=1 Tax=Cichorium intybus TaxID=13427 RepID=A0ACB9DW73_CICIN|nr:hypothetical protein L2E82_21656 [Cichorium intybus]
MLTKHMKGNYAFVQTAKAFAQEQTFYRKSTIAPLGAKILLRLLPPYSSLLKVAKAKLNGIYRCSWHQCTAQIQVQWS